MTTAELVVVLFGLIALALLLLALVAAMVFAPERVPAGAFAEFLRDSEATQKIFIARCPVEGGRPRMHTSLRRITTWELVVGYFDEWRRDRRARNAWTGAR
jgi:hypothetical protein